MRKFLLVSTVILLHCVHSAWVPPPNNLANYDGYGSLLTMNKHFVILAQNDIRHFRVILDPLTNNTRVCATRYIAVWHGPNSFAEYVYSVAIGSQQELIDDDRFYFAFIDEDRNRHVFITIMYFFLNSATKCFTFDYHVHFNVTDLTFSERGTIAMDPRGTRVYAMGYLHTVVIDVTTRIGQIYHKDYVFGTALFGPLPPLSIEKILTYVKALSVGEDQRLYVAGQRLYNFQYLAYLQVLDFSDLSHNRVRLISAITLSPFDYGTAAIEISRYSTMSICFDERQRIIAVGMPHVDTVMLLALNETNLPSITRRHESRKKGIGFGKSITIFPDRTYAVLAYGQPTLPWSTSQVQVYPLDREENEPLFVFPNNQQPLPIMNLIQPPYGMLTLAAYDMNIAVVFEAGGVLYLPASPPGYSSSRIANDILYGGYYTASPCPIGTSRNTTSFGPCFICPPQTKNNGNSSTICQECSSDPSLLCLRGSRSEVPWDRVASFDQATAYPDSSEGKEFDDVLLNNVFQFGVATGLCLFHSPLFWAIVSIGCCLFIVLGLYLAFRQSRRQYYLTFARRAVSHVDLIGEGKLWIGGLVSLALVVLIIFTCKFSLGFAGLYPLESIVTTANSLTHCNPALLNAKFTSALQLLSIRKHEEERPIFQLLDEQQIMFIADFVSTDFACNNVSMHLNTNKGQQVLSTDFDCTVDNTTSILTLSTVLPQHLITLQYDLWGSSFVGGLRICFAGQPSSQDDERYRVEALRFCQFLYTPNETLTINALINVKLTRVLNRTAPFRKNDQMKWAGLWLPTLTVNTLADTFLFTNAEKYQRYLSDRVRVVIDLTESEFYLENIQEPIARPNEITFQTVLFSSEYR